MSKSKIFRVGDRVSLSHAFYILPIIALELVKKDLTRVADYCLYGMKRPVSTTHKILKEEFVSFFEILEV